MMAQQKWPENAGTGAAVAPPLQLTPRGQLEAPQVTHAIAMARGERERER